MSTRSPIETAFLIRSFPYKMSEFPSEYTAGQSKTLPNNGDLSSMVENLNMKSSLLNKMNSTSCLTTSAFSASTEKLTSTSAQVVKSSATASTASASSVLSKKQVVHSLSSQELLKQQQQQNELFQENRNFSRSVSLSSSSSSSNSSESRLKMLSSQRGFSVDCNLAEEMNGGRETSPPQEMRFQQKRVTQASKTKVTTDGFTAEKMAASNQEMKRVHAGDVSYEEKSAMAAMKAKMEGDGFSTEKVAAVRQDQKQLKVGDTIEQQCTSAMGASMKVSTNDFTAEKVAMAKQEQRQTVTQGLIQQEKNLAATATSKVTITSKASSSMSSTSSSSMISKQREIGSLMSSPKELLCLPSSQRLSITQGIDDDLKMLSSPLVPSSETSNAIARYEKRMASCIEELKAASDDEASHLLCAMSDMVRKAWAVPTVGYDLGSNLCHILRNTGGLDILIKNCTSENDTLQFNGARLLEQCLSTENRAYIIEKGLEEVVSLACNFTTMQNVAKARVGTGILEHLFKHSEAACGEVIRMGGLKSILYDCRSSDVECLQHCAKALANLALYGGSENQQAMIKQKAPMWLFPLAFNPDDNIKYYACLAITSLVANKEIEAAVLRSGTLDLVEPFVTSHSPEDFASSSVSHVHGQSKSWLMRLVPVLDSKREEARSLAAFHFAMEAGIKKKQGNTNIFHEIGAVEALRKVASSPNAIASKYAAQALQLIGEQVPHKLLQQVPLWTVEDVQEWVKQIGFPEYSSAFAASRVDGDLLLQLNEEMLREDIGITNGIRRKRFRRELIQLKRMADYSSCDTSNLNQLLQSIGTEFSQYTYTMLQCGVDRETIRFLSEDQLSKECGVDNSIHRLRIVQAIQRGMEQNFVTGEGEAIDDKRLDVFISYRRSNGSQLASLLKVHLQLRSFSVFIDVERLEAGKFDNNLLHSIRQAKHFLLVLTPNALDRCIEDTDCKDWVHREIVEALRSQCNIIPILDNFQWPDPESLPEDMRAVSYFNGIKWIHDYQDACVDKLERFMRGEMNVRCDGPLGRYVGIGGGGTPGTPSTIISHTGGHPYHRSASSDSAKGSTSSEKEMNGHTLPEGLGIHC